MEHKKSSQEMRPISAYLHQKRRDWEKKHKKFKNITNHNVPVLFASSDGLYLRLVDESGKFSCNFLISSFLKHVNVKFGFCNRIIYIYCWDFESFFLYHSIESVNSSCGFFRQTFNVFKVLGELCVNHTPCRLQCGTCGSGSIVFRLEAKNMGAKRHYLLVVSR